MAQILIGLVILLALAGPAMAGNQNPPRKRTVPQPTPPPVVQPVLPPVPLTLEQQPTSAPQVTYLSGQLTIAAQNATLADVLRAVRAQTGAVVEISGNATERVVGHFGPGPAQAVLASLLNGSRYNYVLMGSAANPDALVHVIVTFKTSGDAAEVAANGEQPQPGQPGDQPQADPVEDMGLLGDNSDDAGADPEQILQPEGQSDAEVQPEGQFGAAPPRSPQQMLQDLQRQQLQQQQQGQGVPIPGRPLQPIQPNQIQQ